MAATFLTLFLLAAARPDSLPAPAAPDSAGPRIVRRLPPLEVRAALPDLRSAEVTHIVTERALASLPAGGLADVVALQPGVVVQAGELHVRGGRAGESVTLLDGLALAEPQGRRSMAVPLAALRGAELVSGAPDARYGGALAGVLDLHTADPTPALAGCWRWEGDGGAGTRYDRVRGRVSGPLRIAGLGAVVAGDATFDDTAMPVLRTRSTHDLLGLRVGWRAENQLLGFVKLAPVEQPERIALEVAASREVTEPFDPEWSLDGWTVVPSDPKQVPRFSPAYVPGAQRWNAADHLDLTDTQRLAAQLVWASAPGPRRARARLGWLRTRATTALGGTPGAGRHRPFYEVYPDSDVFHVVWGDDPYERESGSDVLTLEGQGEVATRSGASVGFGAGASYEQMWLHETNGTPVTWLASEGVPELGLDTLRAYRAFAPGGWAWAQGRWPYGGMIVNAGLRAELWSAGPQAAHQTLPGSAAPALMLSPRFGLAYPLTLRDAFSFSYIRLNQAPDRDLLYDTRTAVANRSPLGNPGIRPATVISYEAAVKHVFGPAWALQVSLFYRDLFGQPGVRDYSLPGGTIDLRYVDGDEGHAAGFELSLMHAAGAHGDFELCDTWMEAWGDESRSSGDPYGAYRADLAAPITDRPLSWDRRHTVVATGAWRWPAASLAWSTLVGSPLPWTPRDLVASSVDEGAVDSRRLGWSEATNLDLRWSPRRARGFEFGLAVRNLFDNRAQQLVSVDGYPNPTINTVLDEYAAWRTATGQPGGAYWSPGGEGGTPHWIRVDDPRLFAAPRAIRFSVGRGW